jgi:DMSO/TMAO reductase YedYZ heme-binding membrane subunit
VNAHIWWYLARSSGVVAWALATASVLWGMALSTRALGRKPRAPWLLDLHRFLGGLTVLFVVAHIGSLMADSFVPFSALDVLVPFASAWKPGAVAWGIIAFYILLAVEVTSLLRSRLSKRLWRAVHLCSYGVYVLASIHFIAAGTDAGPAARAIIIASLGFVLFFLIYVAVGPGRAASVSTKAATRTRSLGEPRVPERTG